MDIYILFDTPRVENNNIPFSACNNNKEVHHMLVDFNF